MDCAQSEYHRRNFNPQIRSEVINTAITVLSTIDFTHIAVRGTSGLLFGPTIADRMEKNLIVVRKTTENSHADYLVEGLPRHELAKIVILDDFQSYGNTITRIILDILEQRTKSYVLREMPIPKFVGIYLYNDSREAHQEGQPDFECEAFRIPYLNKPIE